MVHLGLVSSLSIENILYPNNASFTVEIDKLVKRTVAVNTDSLPGFRIADGYAIVGNPVSKPAFVMAQGPQNVVDNIGAVRVESMKKRTVSPADSIVSAALRIPRYVSVEPQEVSLHFSVEPTVIREITGIHLTLKGFPRQNRPRFRPDSLSVTFRGPKSFISSIKPADVSLTVDYKNYLDIKNRGETTIVPSATLPDRYERVDVVDISPRAVRFEVTP
jgi:hypothetical protein